MKRKDPAKCVYVVALGLLLSASAAFHLQLAAGAANSPAPRKVLTDAACRNKPAPAFPMPVFPANI